MKQASSISSIEISSNPLVSFFFIDVLNKKISWLTIEIFFCQLSGFNLLNEYKINDVKINHYDLFRIKSIEEIKNLNLFENNSKVITLIEWPEIIKKRPDNLIELIFKYEENHQKRSLQIRGINL